VVRPGPSLTVALLVAGLLVAGLLATACAHSVAGAARADPGVTVATSALPSIPLPTRSAQPPSGSAPGGGTGGTGGNSTPAVPGWHTVVNQDAHLVYDVPPDWREVGDPVAGAADAAPLAGHANAPEYTCQNSPYSRGLVGSTSIGADSDPATSAGLFAKQYADVLYHSAQATTQLGQPRQVQQQGRTAFLVDAIVTTTGSQCLASKGQVTVLAIDSKADGQVVQIVVINVDLEGGPATPPALTTDLVTQIAATVRQVT
jgi:hypothetical protein